MSFIFGSLFATLGAGGCGMPWLVSHNAWALVNGGAILDQLVSVMSHRGGISFVTRFFIMHHQP